MKTKLLVLLLLCLSLPMMAQISQSTAMLPINVSVTGFVAEPGVYQLTIFSRLSDAISLSRGLLPKIDNPLSITPMQQKQLDADSLYTNFQGLRQVRLTRAGKSQSYDLIRFKRLGELEQNPLLKDGDVVWVPAMEKSVSVSGCVYLPGEFQYVEGDKLGDLLALCQGPTPDADLRQILVYRYQPNGIDFQIIRQDLSSLSEYAMAAFALQDKDRIIVNRDSQARRGWKVTIEGAVQSPGDYLISEASTLWDILQLCGGPSLKGDLAKAVLINGPYRTKIDPDLLRLKEFSITQMSPIEYNFMRNSLRQLKGKYSLNLQETWDSKGEKSNPVLSDGDYIFVPEKLDMIAVSGQVRNPGLVEYIPGKDWRYYIKACGGYTNNRMYNGVRVIRDASGNWVKPKKSLALMPGDMIYVPEKTDRDFWVDLKDVVLLTSQVLTIFLTLRAITIK